MKKKLTLILTLVLLAIAAALVVRAIRGSHTLKDTSEPELIRAYYDGVGWVRVGEGAYKVWSSDRSMEYTKIGDTITVHSTRIDDAHEEYFVAYVDGKVDVDELSIEYLVDLIRSGDWNGRWLYCPASGQLAKNTGCGLVLYQDGVYWETSVFPAIGYDELPYQRAWRDSETGWTYYASEHGIGAWCDDGTPALFVPVAEFDPENAFVFFGSYSNRAAYAGDGKIFRISSDGQFELMFDDFDYLVNDFGNYWTFFRKDGSEWNMYGRPVESMDTQEAYDYGIGVDDGRADDGDCDDY